jgi:hypothetical protein
MSNIKSIDSNIDMIAIATSNHDRLIFSRFIFSQFTLKNDNFLTNVDISIFRLHPKGIFIKNKNSLFTLYVNKNNNIVILAEINL